VSLLDKFLPEEVKVRIDESNSSLRALNLRSFLESPRQTILRIYRREYYRSLLRGEYGVVLDLSKPDFAAGSQNPPFVSLRKFVAHWRNPGFSFRDRDPYLVRTDLAVTLNPLHLGWEFGRERPISVSEEFQNWLSHSGSLLDLDGESVFQKLLRSEDLPPRVRQRLPLYVESDQIIKEEFLRNNSYDAGIIVLISGDWRLAADLVRLAESRDKALKVFCLRPAYYMYGRLWESPWDSIAGNLVIEDPGAMTFEDMAHFTNGVPPAWIEDSLRLYQHKRCRNVFVIESGRKSKSGALLECKGEVSDYF
jgi:hypothetical protein